MEGYINMHLDSACSPSERLLAEFQLFQQMWQQLIQCVITNTALYNVGSLMGTTHDLDP